MKEISTIGLDIAKSSFRAVAMNAVGKVVWRRSLYRSDVLTFMAKLTPCVVGLEACGGAHFWARELAKLGHTPKLMPPRYVKPYVKTNKNDNNDAEACAEAVTRPTMRFAAVKTEEQQVLGQVHKARERLIKARTALCNEIRGFLGEFGVVLQRGRQKLGLELTETLLKQGERLAVGARETIDRLRAELRRIDEEIEHYDRRIEKAHKASELSVRLESIPGIGPITATAIVATFSSAEHFKNGRQFAAYLGLVPLQYSTGGKSRLGHISKRGDVYLRKLLVEGAQSVLNRCLVKTDRYHCWARRVLERRERGRAAVAVANKNARIAWRLLADGGAFDGGYRMERQVA